MRPCQKCEPSSPCDTGREIHPAKSELVFADRWGAMKARCAIGRMDYRVEAGLYALGEPTKDSPILVSANYKLSFDCLRSRLAGRSVWILVLDTDGINVWCAAGKGAFGTEELVNRIEITGLPEIVSNRKLVVPQLGAPGVSAHEVRRQSGFKVIYGPVRAQDLPEFLDGGMKATPEMRRVRFPLKDRLMLVPTDLVQWNKYLLGVAVLFFLLAGLSSSGFSLSRAVEIGIPAVAVFLIAFLTGAVLGPVFLPWLPGRAFATKGFVIGLVISAGLVALAWARPDFLGGKMSVAAWIVLVPAITSFVVMNFTGASTYTSLSGVKREMRFAMPIQTTCAVIGLGLWVVARFV